jgi:hypothetical protein
MTGMIVCESCGAERGIILRELPKGFLRLVSGNFVVQIPDTPEGLQIMIQIAEMLKSSIPDAETGKSDGQHDDIKD